MRIRAHHIIFLVLALIAGFVVFSVQMLPREGTVATGSLPPEGADPSQVPDIELETRDKHLGTVPNDRITRAPFIVYNRGKAPLELRDVRTSCACTQGEIPPGGNIIAPGESGQIILVFDPARVPGFNSKKHLSLLSNDLDTPEAEFDVSADIEPEFTMSSRNVEFGDVSKRALPTHTLLLRQAQDKPFTITDAQPRPTEGVPGANDLLLSVELLPEDTWARAGYREYAVKVALPADTTPGEVTRLFDLFTDIPRLRRFPILVKATLTAPYRVEPSFPEAVQFRAGQPGLATVSATEPITVESIEADAGLLQVTAKGSQDSTRIELEFTPAEQAPAGPLASIVRFSVHTAEGVFPDKVLVRGVVMPQVTKP